MILPAPGIDRISNTERVETIVKASARGPLVSGKIANVNLSIKDFIILSAAPKLIEYVLTDAQLSQNNRSAVVVKEYKDRTDMLKQQLASHEYHSTQQIERLEQMLAQKNVTLNKTLK